MILADTSVLIDFLKGKQNPAVAKLEHIISANIPFGINTFIYQELLQGASTDRELTHLKRYLDTQIFYELRNGRESFASAAKMYCRCRKAGITVNSTIDLLIVQTALENNVALLHNDGDFTNIKKAVPELRIF